MQKLIDNSNERAQLDALLDAPKTELIDFACLRYNAKSFADLGGVWRVEGGYTFYVLQRYCIERALLVDMRITSTVLARNPRIRIFY